MELGISFLKGTKINYDMENLRLGIFQQKDNDSENEGGSFISFLYGLLVLWLIGVIISWVYCKKVCQVLWFPVYCCCLCLLCCVDNSDENRRYSNVNDNDSDSSEDKTVLLYMKRIVISR